MDVVVTLIDDESIEVHRLHFSTEEGARQWLESAAKNTDLYEAMKLGDEKPWAQ